MMKYDNTGEAYDGMNWCVNSEKVIKLNKERPWETRKNMALFHGAGSGKNRKHFGFGERNYTKEEKEVPNALERTWPTPEEVDKLVSENPGAWTRAAALNISYYNPDFMRVRIFHDDANLDVMKKQWNLTEGQCL